MDRTESLFSAEYSRLCAEEDRAQQMKEIAFLTYTKKSELVNEANVEMIRAYDRLTSLKNQSEREKQNLAAAQRNREQLVKNYRNLREKNLAKIAVLKRQAQAWQGRMNQYFAAAKKCFDGGDKRLAEDLTNAGNEFRESWMMANDEIATLEKEVASAKEEAQKYIDGIYFKKNSSATESRLQSARVTYEMAKKNLDSLKVAQEKAHANFTRRNEEYLAAKEARENFISGLARRA